MGDNNMSDLEQLLEDLGRPKSVAPTKKGRASVVNLNELEALMTDLADAPAPPRVGASKITIRAAPLQPSAPVASKPPPKPSAPAAVTFEADDLDSIMDALNGDFGNSNSYGGSGRNDPVAVEAPSQAPPVHVPTHTYEHEPAPPPVQTQTSGSRITSTNTIDELEDLLNGLEDTRASVRVAPAPAKSYSSNSRILASPPAPAPAAPQPVVSKPASSYSGGSRIMATPPAPAPVDDYDLDSFAESLNSYSAPTNNYAPSKSSNSRIMATPPATQAPPSNSYTPPAKNQSSLSFNNYSAPTNNYQAPDNNYSAPTNNYSSPANNYSGNNYSAPTNNYSTPANNYSAPSNNYSAPRNNYSAPSNNYSAPSNNYSAPTNNYSAPANNYSAPTNNYSAPTNNYSAPTNNYSAPTNNYSAPTNNYSAPSNQFKPEQRQFAAKPPAVRPMPDTSLDMLLGDLQEQLKAAPDPSMPSSHGACAACNKPILGELISALGRRFHPEHFTCGNCMTPLGTSNFYEQDGVPNCERCYQELLCPRCAHCDEPILDRCVTALGKKWHIDHFICTQCLCTFPNGTFYERDSRPFCENCFSTAFAPRCGGCNQPIQGPCMNALGQAWHPEHFVCNYCQKAFTGSFFDFGGKPYCDLHYHQQTGSLCGGCNKAVTGKCVDALGKKWHPDHFVCAFCMNPLAAGGFTENGNKAYCRDCHGKLFG